jgi:hypothetical protein
MLSARVQQRKLEFLSFCTLFNHEPGMPTPLALWPENDVKIKKN